MAMYLTCLNNIKFVNERHHFHLVCQHLNCKCSIEAHINTPFPAVKSFKEPTWNEILRNPECLVEYMWPSFKNIYSTRYFQVTISKYTELTICFRFYHTWNRNNERTQQPRERVTCSHSPADALYRLKTLPKRRRTLNSRHDESIAPHTTSWRPARTTSSEARWTLLVWTLLWSLFGRLFRSLCGICLGPCVGLCLSPMFRSLRGPSFRSLWGLLFRTLR